jgi:hypothetical protein
VSGPQPPRGPPVRRLGRAPDADARGQGGQALPLLRLTSAGDRNPRGRRQRGPVSRGEVEALVTARLLQLLGGRAALFGALRDAGRAARPGGRAGAASAGRG